MLTFVHAGIVATVLDSACGYAIFSLMPANAGVLTVEFKTNLLSPAKGRRFFFRGGVVKSGRTLTFCEGCALADEDGRETMVATMAATMMVILPR